jgi:hypothetical protein
VQKQRQNRRGELLIMPSPLLDENFMLYKVPSGYTAKFLAKEKSFTSPPGFSFSILVKGVGW